MRSRFNVPYDSPDSSRSVVSSPEVTQKSRFLEGPETRQILLSSLDEVRDRWNDSELLEILKHYDFKVDG